jgi:hypothetical protein
MMSASINEVFCCLHQQRVHQWMRCFVASIKKDCITSLMEATKHLIYWCTHHWWRQQNTSFIEAIFIDGSNKSPHLLMHSSLMEATNHLIYWCTHHWWRQQITSFIDALFVDGSNKTMRCFVASINDECINKWGDMLLPSMMSASINEVISHSLMHSLLMEATKHLIHWCTLCWWRQQNTSFISTKSSSIN